MPNYMPFNSYPPGFSNASVRAAESKRAEVEGIQRQVTSYVVTGTAGLLNLAMSQVGRGIYDSLYNAAQAFNTKVVNDRATRLTKIHEAVAEDAQVAILEAWKEGRSGPYRNNVPDKHGRTQRDAGGALRRAVGSPNFYRASKDGIDFINPVWMDSQARQWYRINFGAGARGRSTPAAAPARFTLLGDVVTASPLAAFSAGRASPLPPGYWMSGRSGDTAVDWDASRRGGDSFYLRSGLKGKKVPGNLFQFLSNTWTPSLGFAGNRYLDAGVVALYRNLGFEYDKLIQEWLKEWKTSRSGPFVSQGVVGARVKDLQRTLALVNREIRDRERFWGSLNGTRGGTPTLRTRDSYYGDPF
jgi:hypothetical protein